MTTPTSAFRSAPLSTSPIPVRPQSLNLQAIDTCNSRCVMCNIWQDGRREKLTLDELRRHLAHPIFSEVTHVGVTGGEPTLRTDLADLYRMLPQCLPKLTGASFITHGMQTKRAVQSYAEVHEHYRRLKLVFDGMVSLDGVGVVHDRVRGRPGAFGPTTQTLLALKERGVPVIAACTIVRSNVYGLHDLLDWGKAHGVYVRFRVAEFIRRLYNDSCTAEIRGFDQRELRHLVSFFHLLLSEYETNQTIQKTYRSILSLLTGGGRLIGCPYQKGLAVNVDSRGWLACCAPKGSAFEMTSDAGAAHSTLEAQRQEVAQDHCANCVHDYHDDWNEAASQDVAQARDGSCKLYDVPDESLTAPEAGAQPLELAGMKQVLLAGWYGTETAGDIAILQGIITEYLGVNPELQFQVLSLHPCYTRTTVAVWPEALRSRIRIVDYAGEEAWNATLDCDALIMAGGPLMDIHETRKILCLFKRFADLGKPRVIEGCGVGPLNRAEYRWNVCRIARLATRISVRDRASREALRAFGIRKDILVRPDPATTFIRAQGIRHHGSETKVIRCFLRELTCEYPQSLSPGQATANLAVLLQRLLEWYPEHRIELWAMHHFPVGQDDRLFARQLVRQIANPRLTCDWEPRSPGEILESMAAAELCVCMRFHSCVFAAEVGAPFLAIDYTAGGKIKGFLEDTRQERRLCGLADLASLEKSRFEEKVRGPAPGLARKEGACTTGFDETSRAHDQESGVAAPNPPRILHIIQSVTGGGGARAMISLAKHSRRLGGFQHRAVSLIPADATGLELANQAGLAVLNAPSHAELLQAMADADLVLVHWWNNPELAALFRRELPPMRLALWLHVGGYHSPQVLTQPVLDFADLAVGCSPHTYAHPVFATLSEEARAHRTAMVLAGADFDRLHGLTPRAHEGFQIGYIGTVDPVKMHSDFVPMSCAVRVPDAKFVVCGGGDFRWLADQVEKRGRSASFDFKGHVEDIRAVLENLDVYGYPLCADTYAAAELNLQEAMFAGVPVVAFPHGGIGRLIQHGETGLLVETPEAYARAIEHLHQNADERARLGANAAAFARSSWGAENAARAFHVHFEDLLARPKRERQWGASPSGLPDSAIDLVPELAIHPGARMFVESLADGAQPFLESLTAPRLEEILAAEMRIAGLPRLMHYTGVLSFRNAHSKDPLLQLWAGLGFLHSGNAGEALGAFALAGQNGFTHWRLHWYRALTAELAGKSGEAAGELKLLLEFAPDFAPAQELLRRLGFSQPPANISPSTVLPEGARGCFQHGERLLQQGQFASARDWLERALDLAPDEPGLMEALCELDCQLGNLDSAQQLYQGILKLDPLRNSARLETIQVALGLRPPMAVPLVSVLVSTYNSERYLRACLEDLLAQTIAHRLEIIVIDSGSEQNERAIVEEFQRRHDNIIYLRTERETLYAAWNRGVQKARGLFITNANSDDSHRPDALEMLVAALEKHPEASLAYGDYFTSAVPNDTFANPHILRRVVHPPYHPATLLFYCVIGCHPMWRRTVFDKIGLFDSSFTAPGDYEFLLRFAQAGLRAVRVPQELSLFYQNPDGLSFKAQSKSQREFNLIQAKYRAEMPIERLFKVDPAHPQAVARAWVALGNLAIRYQAPWFDNISQDLDYAITCYTRSLEHEPHNTAALHNLAVAKILRGLPGESESLLQQLPREQAGKLRAVLRGGCLELMTVDVPPSVEPFEFPISPPLPIPDATASKIVASPPTAGRHAAGTGAGLPIRWVAPFFQPGEYAGDALNLVLPLSRQIDLGVADQSEPYSAAFAANLAPATRKSLQGAFEKFPFIAGGIAVSHRPASQFNRVRGAAYHIGRTMFETDGLPPDWVRVCNQMDEIWVPSRFNMETFARAGVERDKLFVVPGAVDTVAFDPADSDPAPRPHRAGCNFLSVFEWSARSGWDVLLAAYGREFSAEDDVCLHLRAWLPDKTDAEARETIEQTVRDFMDRLDLGGKAPPRIQILPARVPEVELPRLYRAADCFVSPHRAEGSGRALLEAMAMGLPVIATHWGSSGEIVNADTGYPLDAGEVEVGNVEPELRRHRGHHWANPSERHLRELMRRVQQHRDEAGTKGRKARAHVQQNFSAEVVTDRVVQRLREIERKLSTPACAPAAARALTVTPEFPGRKALAIQVAWEGSFLDLGSLSHVNRELTKPLAAQPHIQLTCVGKNSLPEEPGAMPALREMARRLHAQPNRQTHVTVRHAWPPDWQAPASGLWVLIQPWEFGVLPTEWVRQLGRVNEVWVPSEYVRRVYVGSGVEPDKVKVVPNGIDPAVFRPDAVPMKLATHKRFKFLFVGGTIHRKGPDLLLQAYLERFTAADDVCLVIKDFGGKSVYAGQTFEAQIQTAQAKPGAPEILYLNHELSPDELPGLYTACDCLVHPYRGEGFGLPVLEAMACGLPVIVTGGGATDDFATDEFVCRLPALRQSLTAAVGAMELVREGWLLEPSPQALVESMAEVFRNPEPARAKGRAASVHVRREWTWERAAQIAAQRLHNLVGRQQAAHESLAKRRARIAPAMELPPVARLGQLNEARTAVRDREFASAWSLACSAIDARPYHPEGYLLLAEIAQACGDPARARQCAERARQLAPRWKPAKEFLKSLPSKAAANRQSNLPLPKAAGATAGGPRLSVCLIVRNEAQFLGRCLESVRDLAQQLIVVDTGSTDSTVEIARRHGAEVYSFPWGDDFSAARNASLERATGDWVLVLDADEELSPEGRMSLKQEMKVVSVMAYRLPILDRGREEDGCSYVPRLFRNAPGLFFVGRVHEQVFSSVEVRRQEWGLENRLGKSALIHHGYIQEVAQRRQKNARNLALLEKAIEEMPNEPNLVMNHGLELIRAGQFEAGLEAYWEAFHLLSALPAEQVIPELREALLTQLASHLLGAKDFNAVARVLRSPLAKAQGLSASLHFSLGLALMELKQFAAAAEQMSQCLSKRHQPALTPGNKEIRGAAPRHCLAVCLKLLKQTNGAARAFAEARAEDPNSRPVCFDHARFLVEQDQPVEALKLLHQMIPAQPEDADVWLLGGSIALGRPEFLEFARDWTGEALQHLPQHPQVMLQRAEALLLSGDTQASLALWENAGSPTNARHLAARLICGMDCGRAAELAGGALAAGAEPILSDEFLKWYRRLLESGAARTVSSVNSRIDQVRRILPTAGRVLGQALIEADQAAAV